MVTSKNRRGPKKYVSSVNFSEIFVASQNSSKVARFQFLAQSELSAENGIWKSSLIPPQDVNSISLFIFQSMFSERSTYAFIVNGDATFRISLQSPMTGGTLVQKMHETRAQFFLILLNMLLVSTKPGRLRASAGGGRKIRGSERSCSIARCFSPEHPTELPTRRVARARLLSPVIGRHGTAVWWSGISIAEPLVERGKFKYR